MERAIVNSSSSIGCGYALLFLLVQQRLALLSVLRSAAEGEYFLRRKDEAVHYCDSYY